MRKKKGEMGIGTLILFIAMILVAAIAAGVLIRTATSLQSKALLTGERSKEQVATSIQSVMLTATNATDNTVENVEQTIKLSPGSDPVKLGDLTLQVDLSDTSGDIKYNTSQASCEAGGWSTTFFTAVYEENGTLTQTGYLQRGDLIKLCYALPRSISEDESITISMIPKIGNVEQLDIAVPNVMSQDTIILYP